MVVVMVVEDTVVMVAVEVALVEVVAWLSHPRTDIPNVPLLIVLLLY